MNLTIDIGNTLIKMAVFDGGEIVEKLLAEECDTKLLDGLLARWPAIDRAIIASTGGRTARRRDRVGLHLRPWAGRRRRGCCGCVP